MNERILCRHCDEQHTITGSWCTPELQKAVEGGYRIHKIHEVWHWPEDKRKTGFFHPTWTPGLNTKQRRVDGLTIVTQEKKDQYVTDFEAQEGIKLEKIEKNPGRKQVAKLMLNR